MPENRSAAARRKSRERRLHPFRNSRRYRSFAEYPPIPSERPQAPIPRYSDGYGSRQALLDEQSKSWEEVVAVGILFAFSTVCTILLLAFPGNPPTSIPRFLVSWTLFAASVVLLLVFLTLLFRFINTNPKADKSARLQSF